jgi:hypothetical protein
MKAICVTGILVLFLAYFLWAYRRQGDRQQAGENPLLRFYIPGIWLLVKKIRRIFHLKMKGERYEGLRRMYVGMGESELFCLYYSKMGSVIAVILTAGLIALAGTFALGDGDDLMKSYYVRRGDVAQGDRNLSFRADNGREEREITVKIPERKYTQEEKEKALAMVKKEIKESLPGENASLDKVTKPLVLLKSVPGTAIDITWELGQEGLIGEDGSVENDGITEPMQQEITAILAYGEEEERMVHSITVYPEEQSLSQAFWTSWEKLWNELEESSRTEKYAMLPQKVAGNLLTYHKNHPSLYGYILVAMFCLILLVPLWFQSRAKAENQKRQEQLREDYPEFVEHFVLLIGAGLTVRGTWERIVRDYEKRQGQRHYVYEEMALSLREMDCGMSETKAYELFGKRTGLLSYMKFCTLIVQNLRKGSADLLRLLDFEVADAFHQRKEDAKELGEKAGTKLLLPMAVMLALVFVMILYAAFRSM